MSPKLHLVRNLIFQSHHCCAAELRLRVGLIHALVEASDIFIRVSPALNGSLKTGAIVMQDNFGVAVTSIHNIKLTL